MSHEKVLQLEEGVQKPKASTLAGDVDELTGIGSPDRFKQELKRAWRRRNAYGGHLTIATFEIDFFKEYGWYVGHARANRTLRSVANILACSASGPRDVAARYADEKFVLILPNASQVFAKLQRIRQSVYDLSLPNPGSKRFPFLTISAGACTTTAASPKTAHILLIYSLSLMHFAQSIGGNLVFADTAK